MNFSYKQWENKFREYISNGIDLLDAWHLANRDFGIGREEYEKFLRKEGVADRLQKKMLE